MSQKKKKIACVINYYRIDFEDYSIEEYQTTISKLKENNLVEKFKNYRSVLIFLVNSFLFLLSCTIFSGALYLDHFTKNLVLPSIFFSTIFFLIFSSLVFTTFYWKINGKILFKNSTIIFFWALFLLFSLVFSLLLWAPRPFWMLPSFAFFITLCWFGLTYRNKKHKTAYSITTVLACFFSVSSLVVSSSLFSFFDDLLSPCNRWLFIWASFFFYLVSFLLIVDNTRRRYFR